MTTLRDDGVDLDRFYACVYESALSTGGWLRIDGEGESLHMPLPAMDVDGPSLASRRIDIKLCVRASTSDAGALQALAEAEPCGDLPIRGCVYARA